MILRILNALLICILVVFLFLAWTHHAKAQDVAIGDSIALGTGRALGVETHAWVGASSCNILRNIHHLRYRNVVVSAGINDPPGLCVRQLLASIQATRIVVILPAAINSARRNVEIAAVQYGAYPISYQCNHGCTRRNFHPASYINVARSVRAIWNETR